MILRKNLYFCCCGRLVGNKIMMILYELHKTRRNLRGNRYIKGA